ncbi:MAG: alpha-glucan family phosphorylase [Bacteroidota bacterium]|nr:alpha-glucan family phosphorylase [Bacteroidota bacterium]
MSQYKLTKPDYLFETSWEICNKVGGIYTVLSTKALTLVHELKDNYILIGPDVWKETIENPDFIEDPLIFKSWREKARHEGLHIRLGRWNVAGKPIVILVDFTPYFSEKDKIFFEFWETYKLDSLTGHWDYIEPALFGYAAARVIESFYEFHLSAEDKIVAQFHEWMTGTGILYLNDKVPQVGTIFTTHATVLGRSIAGNGFPLYEQLDQFNAPQIAKDFGVVSKFSLERLSAREADCFTTVSEITSKECEAFLGKNVDVITVNGFENSFVPDSAHFDRQKENARDKILKVARGMLNQDIPDDAVLTLNSGRYEFGNKGMDLFIDALGQLNKMPDETRSIVAFIAVPAHQSGLRRELLKRIEHPDFNHPIANEYLTHHLYDESNDPTLQKLKENELLNRPEDRVKVIFAPAYLDGNDGIFNISYYNFLIGFDITVFPSYYEPWGYTPLESAAFHIPTITTNVAGFGLWVQTDIDPNQKGVFVIDRLTMNGDAVNEIVRILHDFTLADNAQAAVANDDAFQVSQQALWQSFIDNYYRAYTIALERADERAELFKGKLQQYQFYEYKDVKLKQPHWSKVIVETDIPKKLMGLRELSMNLWWSWNCDAVELFEMIDPAAWRSFHNNPIPLLESLSFERLTELEADASFMKKLELVYNRFKQYIDETVNNPDELVGYFSMEFGLHESLRIYSGGLGILAGDYLKEASDSNKTMVGIGILYRNGYFQQQLTASGEQVSLVKQQRFSQLPLIPVRDENGQWVKVSLALPGRTLYAKVWKVMVGRIPLYLLDSDISDNNERDRAITHQLYGGDHENRLKQELLLGVGGIRMLETLGVKAKIYHCNEGHAAFIGIERLRRYVQSLKLNFDQALEVVRSTTLFTTHTPVPAGHDVFSEDLLRTYIPHYAERLNISWQEFMDLGRIMKDSSQEKFSMSILAAKLSQEINGVSKIHGKVSRQMFNDLYPGYFPGELHIGHVTNGVHLPTWTANSMRKLYIDHFGAGFIEDQSNPKPWEAIYDIPDSDIWNIRKALKRNLITFLKEQLREDMTRRQDSPNLIIKATEALDENSLLIGFARRFATYKRADLIFNNLERLAQILNNPEYPVQLVFAGKAHPNDKAGQDLIKRIIHISRQNEFIGKIFFIENYNMDIARKLVQGVDVWLNTPTRPLEASGTSGEKAAMNGVLNFSVLDGWWAEGYQKGAGWAIAETRTYDNQQFQDELDAETIYNMIEDDILPLYYIQDKNAVPIDWVACIKNDIARIAPRFTMKRMLEDYYKQFYHKLRSRSKKLKAHNYRIAGELAHWKNNIRSAWDQMEIESVKVPNSSKKALKLGQNFKAEIRIKTDRIRPTDLGVEVVFGKPVHGNVEHPLFTKSLQFKDEADQISTFTCEFKIEHTGRLDYAFRISPSNKLLPHRQDFNLLRWI